MAFELLRNFVLKGLSPRTNEGDPYPPSQVVFDFIAKLEQELANRDEEAWNLVGLAPDPTAGMAKERCQSQMGSIAMQSQRTL